LFIKLGEIQDSGDSKDMEIVKVRLVKMAESSNLLDAEIRYYSDANHWLALLGLRG